MPYAIRLLSAACYLLVALIFSASAEARRVALVIGNSAYKAGPLANPANDAVAVAKALETQLKFDKVVLRQDLGFIGFRDALSQFSGEAMGADIAVVYFAGHGIEASGVNFLIPVDATLRRTSDLNLQAIALPTVLEQLEGVRSFRFVILDACRDNPFPIPAAKRHVARGLKAIEPEGNNTLVLYAAKEGTTADDGAGRKHSPFTAALLKHLATPRLEVRVLVGRVRDEVMAATGSTQIPHAYGTMGGREVYLRKDALAAPVPELKLPPPPPVQKDEAPSIPPPVAKKDKAPSPAPPPVAKKEEKAPSEPVKSPFDDTIEQLKARSHIGRGWLGVRVQSVANEEMAASLGLKEPKGVLVAEVQSPSPAAAAGIKRGDAILSVNGVKIVDSRHLSRQVAGFQPDATITLQVMRARKQRTVRVKLGLLPTVQDLSKLAPTPTQPTALSQLGLSVGSVQGQSGEGVRIIAIDSDAPVARKLRVGDIILEVDNRPVSSAEELIAAVRDANRENRSAVLLLIKSGNERRFEAVTLRRN